MKLTCGDCGMLKLVGSDLPCPRHATDDQRAAAQRLIAETVLQPHPLMRRTGNRERYKP